MTRTEPSWTRAFPLSALPANSARLFRHGSSQIAVFHRAADPATGETGGLYAIDNRCPHEGYPLLQGSVQQESRGCILTCKWHNFKFRLEDGACVMGEEGVRSYPVRVAEEGGHVEIDLSAPPALLAGLWADLQAGLQKQETGRMARTAVRLLDLGVAPVEIIRAAAVYACDHGDWGISHAPAMASELATALAPGAPVELQLTQLLDLTARSTLGNPARVRPDPADPGADPVAAGARLQALVEAERAAEAEALLRGAVARGWRAAEIRPWLLRLCADHFLDFGHMLIYTSRIFALLEAPDHAPDQGAPEATPEVWDSVLGGLVYGIVCGTREDLLPLWSGWRSRIAAMESSASAGGAPQESSPEAQLTEAGLAEALLEADPPRAFALVAGALATGALAAGALNPALAALSITAAERLLRFDLALDASPDVEEGWLDLTHRLTFVHAIRTVAPWADPAILLRLCLQAAQFVAAARPADGPPPEIRPEPATLEQVTAAVRARQPEEALNRAAGWLSGMGASGGTGWVAAQAEPLTAALEAIALRDHATRAIFLVHHLKTLRAGHRESAATGDPRPLLAAIRYLAAPTRERQVERAVLNAIRLVREGKPPVSRTG